MPKILAETGATGMRIAHGAFADRLGAFADGDALRPEEALYGRYFPYYAELCALSEIRKKPGFGVPVRSGMGGHSLLYLSGVCRDRRAGYPVLELCDPAASPACRGVGISVNSHYKNVNWVAVEGPDFVWRGALTPGEPLTRDGYERTQACAKAIGVLDGVRFHDHLFRDQPRGMSQRDYMYEISVATDYAVCFGRNAYRARIPLERARMAAIVDFLNDLNAAYRDGRRVFRWKILNNNCSHVAHNALAAAAVWSPWPTGQCLARAAFNFPVPKNEFVDLMVRTNDLPIHDAEILAGDELVRRALEEADALPTAPGALASAVPAVGENEIYSIERLRLIFYDHPFWGRYRTRFARIFSEPRYLDLRANLRHFGAVYEMALARRNRLRGCAAAAERNDMHSGRHEGFYAHYERYIERQAAKVRQQIAALDRPAQVAPEIA